MFSSLINYIDSCAWGYIISTQKPYKYALSRRDEKFCWRVCALSYVSPCSRASCPPCRVWLVVKKNYEFGRPLPPGQIIAHSVLGRKINAEMNATELRENRVRFKTISLRDNIAGDCVRLIGFPFKRPERIRSNFIKTIPVESTVRLQPQTLCSPNPNRRYPVTRSHITTCGRTILEFRSVVFRIVYNRRGVSRVYVFRRCFQSEGYFLNCF